MLEAPFITVRKRIFNTDKIEISIFIATSVTIGKIPFSNGIPISCMGTEAKSDIIIAITSSFGSISPNWRLPIIRIETIIKM